MFPEMSKQGNIHRKHSVSATMFLVSPGIFYRHEYRPILEKNNLIMFIQASHGHALVLKVQYIYTITLGFKKL